MSRSVTVVLGPRTRYAAALVARLRGTEPLVLVARHADDATALAALAGDDVTVVDANAEDLAAVVGERLPADPAALRVVVAAAGPVHPGTPHVARDTAAVARDVGFVEQLLGIGVPTQLVLVSTVLALAPAEDRRYYAGWKGVVEQQLAELATTTDTSITVLHPGRLCAGGRTPLARLHTTYDRLVDHTLRLEPARSRSKVIGIDARIWLLMRSISIATRSLRGAWDRGSPVPGRRGHPWG